MLVGDLELFYIHDSIVKNRKEYILNTKVLARLCRLIEYKSKSKNGTKRRI